MGRQLGHIPVQAQGAAVAHDNQHIPVDAEHMVDGQYIEIDFLFRALQVCSTEGVVNQVPVGQHDPLAPACGAGGEKDHGTVLFRYPGLHALALVFL